MKILLLIAFAAFLSIFSGIRAFAQDELTYRAPTQLPDTNPQMLNPGFWISRHSEPDKVMMSADEIREFNAMVRSRVPKVRDILTPPNDFSGDELSGILRSHYEDYQKKEYFHKDGTPVSGLFLQDVLSNLNLSSIAAVIEPEFAFVLRYTDQRFLPTQEPFFERPGDRDFDYLQNNALELSTPVAILHKSFDGKWAYVLGPTSEGWIKTADLVQCAFKDIEEYMSSAEWAVVIVAKADVFRDVKRTQFDQYVQMGLRFPKEKKQPDPDVIAVKVPARRSDGRFVFDTAYISRKDVHGGFLPYTPRTIYEQAFKQLNEPYGWGGMYGAQDCSRFLQQVFGSVGIILPRDSKDQAKVGLGLASFDPNMPGVKAQKLEALDNGVGGMSILTMKGHIMIYLGQVDRKSYAIHAVWAYREPAGGEDRVRVINRVAVSSLDLGSGSQKGSLFERLTGIRNFVK